MSIQVLEKQYFVVGTPRYSANKSQASPNLDSRGYHFERKLDRRDRNRKPRREPARSNEPCRIEAKYAKNKR